MRLLLLYVKLQKTRRSKTISFSAQKVEQVPAGIDGLAVNSF
jgi:hypothetical protein